MNFSNMPIDALGKLGERVFRNIASASGITFIDLCELTRKGAPMSSGASRLILPDFDMADLNAYVDAKAKTASVFWRKAGELRHGIDRKNYADYLKIAVSMQKSSGLFIVELHESDKVTWSGALLAASFSSLRTPQVGISNQDHMVYWSRARFSELRRLSPGQLEAVACGRMRLNLREELIRVFITSAVQPHPIGKVADGDGARQQLLF